nr:hypothetical protein CFP56_32710 [Quercus suber]
MTFLSFWSRDVGMDTEAYLTELTELLFEDISPRSWHALMKTQGVGSTLHTLIHCDTPKERIYKEGIFQKTPLVEKQRQWWKYVKSRLSFSHPRIRSLFQKYLTRVSTGMESLLVIGFYI